MWTGSDCRNGVDAVYHLMNVVDRVEKQYGAHGTDNVHRHLADELVVHVMDDKTTGSLQLRRDTPETTLTTPAELEEDRIELLRLSNLMFADADIEAETTALVAALAVAKGPVVCVTNEVGSGIVPENALARRFRDAGHRLSRCGQHPGRAVAPGPRATVP